MDDSKLSRKYMYLHKRLKQHILVIYNQNVYSRINNSHTLESYRLFKLELELEIYLSIFKEGTYQIIYSKFRLSSHKLAIGQGRHFKIDTHKMLYTNCNIGMIENCISFFY